MQNWLYDISERMIALTDTLETFDGDDTTANDIKAALEQVYGDEVVPAVSDGIEYICQQADDVKALAEKIKRLQALKKSRESRLERVKASYVEILTELNTKKIETPNGNMSIAKTTGSVVIDDVNKLPPAYTVSTVVVTPNKVAIQDAIKRGMTIEGESLRIK